MTTTKTVPEEVVRWFREAVRSHPIYRSPTGPDCLWSKEVAAEICRVFRQDYWCGLDRRLVQGAFDLTRIQTGPWAKHSTEIYRLVGTLRKWVLAQPDESAALDAVAEMLVGVAEMFIAAGDFLSCYGEQEYSWVTEDGQYWDGSSTWQNPRLSTLLRDFTTLHKFTMCRHPEEADQIARDLTEAVGIRVTPKAIRRSPYLEKLVWTGGDYKWQDR